MATIAELVVKLVGDISGFTQGMSDAEKAAQSAGGGILSSLGGGLTKVAGIAAGAAAAGMAAAGAAAVGLGKAALDAAMTLDEAYDTIQIGTGATGDVLESLKGDFKAVFTSMPVDAQSAAQAISELNTKLGLTGKPLQDVTASMLRMSDMLGGDVLTYSQSFGRVVGDWGIPLDQSVGTLDKFFVASQATGIGVDKLMQSLVQFGSPLRLMGFSLDQSVAMLAKWEKEGVNTELVLGSLRIAAGKFADANVPLQQGLQDTITRIQNASTSSEALGIAMDVFGARAGPDMAAAVLEGRFAIDDLVNVLQNAEGAIEGTAAATADFPEKLEMLKNKATVALEPLGSAVMDALGKVLDALLPIVDQLLPVISDALTPAIVAMVEAFAAVVDWVVANWPTIWAAIKPVLDTVLAGVGAVVSWVRDNWPLIERVIGEVFGVVQSVVETVVMPILQVLIDSFNRVVSWVEDNWPLIQRIAETVFSAIRRVIEVVAPIIQRVVSGAFQTIKSVIETVMNVVGDIIKAVMQMITDDWSGAWETIKGAVINIWEGIKGIFQGLPATLLGFGRDMIQGFVDGIGQMAWAVKNAILNLLPPALRDLAAQLGISSPSKVAMWYSEMFVRGMVEGFDRNAHLPQLALRGVVTGIDSVAAQITSDGAQSAPQNPPQINITINAPSGNANEIADEALRAIRLATQVAL